MSVRNVEHMEIMEVLERIAKHLGAIDSQMTFQSRMMAEKAGIELVWHDPSIEPWPAPDAKHGERAVLEQERKIGLPYHLRATADERQS